MEAGKRVYKRVYECQLCNAPDKRKFFCEKGIRTSYSSALSHIEKIHKKTFEAWLQEKRARKRETENTVDRLMSSPIKLSKVFEKIIKWKCDHGVSKAAIQDPLFKWLMNVGSSFVPCEKTMNSFTLQVKDNCRAEMSALLRNFVTIAADTGTSHGRTTCSVCVLSSGNATSWSLADLCGRIQNKTNRYRVVHRNTRYYHPKMGTCEINGIKQIKCKSSTAEMAREIVLDVAAIHSDFRLESAQ